MANIVVVHITAEGTHVYATAGVDQVLWVDENVPNGRVFRQDSRWTEEQITQLVGAGVISGAGKETPNRRQATEARRRPGLSLVDPKGNDR